MFCLIYGIINHILFFFFFNDTATTEIYTLPLHDALPILEFAAARFGTRLVVVLGHTGCGAITATIEELRQPTLHQSAGVRAIVERIRPAVEPLLATPLREQASTLVAHAVRANIRAAVDHMRHGSAILERLVEHDRLLIVGAEYCLRTGVVDFFDGAP